MNITIESQSTAHTLEMLEARKIDIGLVAEPRARRGLNFTPVMEIHDGFVCTPAYMENLTLRRDRPRISSKREISCSWTAAT